MNAPGFTPQEDREDVAAGDPDRTHQPVEQQCHEGRRQHPRHHQAVDRIDTEHPHGVDLFPDGPGPEIRADGRRTRPGDHQHGDHGTELGDGAERGAGAGEVGGTDLPQQDVEREGHQDGERDGHQQRRDQRHPRDHPSLVQEFTELEGPPERRPEGVEGHLEEAADGPSRNRELFDHRRFPSCSGRGSDSGL